MYKCSEYKHPHIIYFQRLMSEQSGYGMWSDSGYTPMTPYDQFEKKQHEWISIYFSSSQTIQKEALWLVL